MAKRTFDVIDVTEVLMHWHADRSLSGMSQSLGVDRKTIRKYVAPAVAAGIAPGGPAKTEADWQGLVRSGSRSWPTRGYCQFAQHSAPALINGAVLSSR